MCRAWTIKGPGEGVGIMKIFFTCIAMCIALLSIASADAPAHMASRFMEVARSDGSLQCGSGPAVSLEETVAEVEAAGVKVDDARKAHDGHKRIAMCGASTGNIHVLTIGTGNFDTVQTLGFEAL